MKITTSRSRRKAESLSAKSSSANGKNDGHTKSHKRRTQARKTQPVASGRTVGRRGAQLTALGAGATSRRGKSPQTPPAYRPREDKAQLTPCPLDAKTVHLMARLARKYRKSPEQLLSEIFAPDLLRAATGEGLTWVDVTVTREDALKLRRLGSKSPYPQLPGNWKTPADRLPLCVGLNLSQFLEADSAALRQGLPTEDIIKQRIAKATIDIELSPADYRRIANSIRRAESANRKISTAVRVRKGLLAAFKKAAFEQGKGFTQFLNEQIDRAVKAHRRKKNRRGRHVQGRALWHRMTISAARKAETARRS